MYNASKDIPVSKLPTNRTTYSYTMGNLEYANEYNITIAAVNHNGVEGERSPALAATLSDQRGSRAQCSAPVP